MDKLAVNMGQEEVAVFKQKEQAFGFWSHPFVDPAVALMLCLPSVITSLLMLATAADVDSKVRAFMTREQQCIVFSHRLEEDMRLAQPAVTKQNIQFLCLVQGGGFSSVCHAE